MEPNIAFHLPDGSIEFDRSKFYWPVIQGMMISGIYIKSHLL